MVFYSDGNKESERYMKHGFNHRDQNKPQYRSWDIYGNLTRVEYYVDGRKHRTNGPAIIRFYSLIGFYGSSEAPCERYFMENMEIEKHAFEKIFKKSFEKCKTCNCNYFEN